MNIMLVSVTERTREIGLRKAVGAGRSGYSRPVLTESLSDKRATGGVAGVILGWGISMAVS